MSHSHILELCTALPKHVFDLGETILTEGTQTRSLYVLIEGCVEVFKEGVLINKVDEPGSIFGEVAALLNTPHMATVRAAEESRFYHIEDGNGFIAMHPEMSIHVATVLAQRLRSITVNLAAVKRSLDTLMQARALNIQPAPVFPADLWPLKVTRVGEFQRAHDSLIIGR